MTTHCHASNYAFQVKKCTDSTCFYCQQNPLRLQPDQFSSLHFLSLPLLDATKEHYQKFEEVFGKPLSNSDQSSRVATPTEEQKETDKRRKSLPAKYVHRSTVVTATNHDVYIPTLN